LDLFPVAAEKGRIEERPLTSRVHVELQPGASIILKGSPEFVEFGKEPTWAVYTFSSPDPSYSAIGLTGAVTFYNTLTWSDLGLEQGAWRLQGWVRNALDESYLTTALPSPLAPSGYLAENSSRRLGAKHDASALAALQSSSVASTTRSFRPSLTGGVHLAFPPQSSAAPACGLKRS
jgi:hypothetical protein